MTRASSVAFLLGLTALVLYPTSAAAHRLKTETLTGRISSVSVSGDGACSANIQVNVAGTPEDVSFVIYPEGANIGTPSKVKLPIKYFPIQPFFVGSGSVALNALLNGLPLKVTYLPKPKDTPVAINFEAEQGKGGDQRFNALPAPGANTMTGYILAVRMGKDGFEFTLATGSEKADFLIKPIPGSEPEVGTAMIQFITTCWAYKAQIRVEYKNPQEGGIRLVKVISVFATPTPLSSERSRKLDTPLGSNR